MINYKKLSIILMIILIIGIYNYNTSQYPSVLITQAKQKINIEEPISITNLQVTQTKAVIYGKCLEIVTTTGTSMLPTSSTHQTEIVETCPIDSDILVGRIVIFSNDYPQDYVNTNPFYIQHRIIWRNTTHFQTMGDNNTIPDKPQNINTIVGVVIALIK